MAAWMIWGMVAVFGTMAAFGMTMDCPKNSLAPKIAWAIWAIWCLPVLFRVYCMVFAA